MSVHTDYHSFSGFAELRAQARAGEAGSTRQVAAQFESMLIQTMLKSMRDTVPEGGLFDSDGLEFYQQMFDQQLTLDLSRGQGVGLRPMIEAQLSARGAPVLEPDGEPRANRDGWYGVPARRATSSVAPAPSVLPVSDVAGSVAGANTRAETVSGRAPLSAQQRRFIEEMGPHARRAAGRLGVSEQVILAQAALESGWGSKVLSRNDGASSHNLFGIKAHGGWRGATAESLTTEFRGGVATRERAEFRAYASAAASFNDYVDFLHSQPRYQQALKADDDRDFATALQKAGYATDPRYADKILSIVERLDSARLAAADAGRGPITVDVNRG